MSDTASTPTEIRVSKDRKTLTIGYVAGETHDLAAELLRVESPSAEVQGHDPSQKKLVPGKKDVTISGIEPVGNYAIRIIFDDGHDTGIFSWAVLDKLVREGDALFATYCEAMRENSLSRSLNL